MDEQEYRDVYHSVNALRCVFEKAILTRTFGCENLVKMNIAEREAAGCSEPVAQRQCSELLEAMRNSAAFTLKLTHISGGLPHAKEVKVQCGGLLGLQKAVYGDAPPGNGVEDIHGLIQAAKEQFGSLAQFPYQQVVQSVSNYQGRRKRGRRK